MNNTFDKESRSNPGKGESLMIDQYELDPVRRKKTIRSLVGYAKQVKRSIFLGLTLLFLAVGAELAGPYIAKIIINKQGIKKEKWEGQTTCCPPWKERCSCLRQQRLKSIG